LSDSSISTSISDFESLHNGKDLLIYPNPAKDQLNIKGSDDLIGKSFFIYNMNGQVQREGIFNSRLNKIDVSKLSNGLYFIMLPERNIREKIVIY
jgi:hypothetical protein